MDIYCPIKNCGEPWDHDTIHEIAQDTGSTYDKVAADFRIRGCVALGAKHNVIEEERDRVYGLTASEAASALYDILGDDMDGAAAMLEDMGF